MKLTHLMRPLQIEEASIINPLTTGVTNYIALRVLDWSNTHTHTHTLSLQSSMSNWSLKNSVDCVVKLLQNNQADEK